MMKQGEKKVNPFAIKTGVAKELQPSQIRKNKLAAIKQKKLILDKEKMAPPVIKKPVATKKLFLMDEEE